MRRSSNLVVVLALSASTGLLILLALYATGAIP